MRQAHQFSNWVQTRTPELKHQTQLSSRHAQLSQVTPHLNGNQVTIDCTFTTQDAAGQNMVTLCTETICGYIVRNYLHPIRDWFIEGNFSGDKKASARAMGSVRGRKAVAEAVINKDLLHQMAQVTPQQMLNYWHISIVNSVQSGCIGSNGHFANALAAIFIATGQDAACVGEASTGIVRAELTPEEDLYISVLLPNLIVGTVGGGTALPSQSECLRIMNCLGTGKADKLAEICAATVLAGELSIAAAICNGSFTRAHRLLGRRKKSRPQAVTNG
jgi:hydroxymethylglutaryl-CoA reductase (NADPH)